MGISRSSTARIREAWIPRWTGRGDPPHGRWHQAGCSNHTKEAPLFSDPYGCVGRGSKVCSIWNRLALATAST